MTTPAATMPSLSMSLFGNLEGDAEDNVPSFAFQGVRRVRKLEIPTTVRRAKPTVVPTLGHSITYPTLPVEQIKEEEEDEDDVGTVADEIEVDIPDEDDYIERSQNKDRIDAPRYDVVGENEFQVSPELVDALTLSTEERETVLRDVLFEQASLLYAYDDASNFVEATMRDGMGMAVEMDRDILPEAFVPLSRLSVLVAFIEQTKLPEQVKRGLLGRLTVRTADDMVTVMGKRRGPEALAAMHKHYAATVLKAGLPPDVEIPQNTLGVRTSRK